MPLVPGVKPRDPVLWVALAAHLRPPEPLRLSSAKGNLTLITNTGRRISAPGLVLGWQMLPLAEPLQISRQVLGPFASFETAETAAQSWRQQGAQAVVAHPGEWEVWAPLGSPPPAVGKPRLWQQLQRQRQRQQLQRQQQAKLFVIKRLLNLYFSLLRAFSNFISFAK